MKEKRHTIDLNCDTGEGIGNEEGLMPFITSCNIACGGHAGSPKSVENMLILAKKYHVKVGAHPSLPDQENFGRTYFNMPADELQNSLIDQIKLVVTYCNQYRLPLHHIKVHGALYNKSATDAKLADLLINMVRNNFPEAILYVPYASVIAERASGVVKINYEGFADRNYEDDHTLVSRKQNNALLKNREEVLKHCLQMITENQITTIKNTVIPTQVDTLCVHGDSPKAVALVQFLYEQLHSRNLLTQNQYGN